MCESANLKAHLQASNQPTSPPPTNVTSPSLPQPVVSSTARLLDVAIMKLSILLIVAAVLLYVVNAANRVEVTVAPDSRLVFDPDTVNINMGDTVRWT